MLMKFFREVGSFIKECASLVMVGLRFFKKQYFRLSYGGWDIFLTFILFFVFILGLSIFFAFWASGETWRLTAVTGLVIPIPEFSNVFQVKDLAGLGSAFGILTTSFTAFAALLVYLTLRVQQKELHLTRTQMQYQQIENTVFQMLDAFNSIIGEIHLDSVANNKSFDGRRAFKTFNKALKDGFVKSFGSVPDGVGGFSNNETEETMCNKTSLELDKNLNSAWMSFWKDNRLWLAHYYRYLYRIMKFIDQSALPYEKKQELSKVVRAQISDYELILLFYNLKSPAGKRFKDLCYRYDLLKHAPKELMLCPQHYEELQKVREEYKH